MNTNLFLPSHSRSPLARSEDEHLIDCMHFIANVATDRDLHADELAVESSVDDLPELPKAADFRREFGEVEHLVFGRLIWHAAVFTHLGC